MDQEFSTAEINAIIVSDVFAISFLPDTRRLIWIHVQAIYSVEPANICEMNPSLSAQCQLISHILLTNSTLYCS